MATDYNLITLEEYKDYVGITATDNDSIYQILLKRASDFIEKYTRRDFLARDYTHERYDGDGGDYLQLENYPVISIAQISIGALDAIRIYYDSSTNYNAHGIVSTLDVDLMVDETGLTTKFTFALYPTLLTMANAINGETNWTGSVDVSDHNSWPSTQLFPQQNVYALETYGYLQVPDEPIYGYEVDANTGIVHYSSGFDTGFNNIFVTYTGGFSAIPDTIKQACCELVKFKFDQSKLDQNLKSESMGDYSYARVDPFTKEGLIKVLPPDLLQELNLFKRPLV